MDYKLWGIEVRRRDTCAFIKQAQTEAIQSLAPATSKEEFYQLIKTKFWEVHAKYDTMLVKRTVPLADLFITKILAKGPAAYKQSVHQVIAAQQLTTAGVHLQSGMKISFLVTQSTSKTTLKRVIAMDLYTGQLYDVAWYQRMLREAFTNIIPPNLTTKKEQTTGSLTDFITDTILLKNYQEEEADYE